MQRYLVSLNNNGSFGKVLTKGSIQEVWEGADVWEDDACGVDLSASLAFDKGRKRILSQSTGRELLLFGRWQPLSLSFFCKLDDQYASADV